MNRKFYRCAHCGNIVTYLEERVACVSCCGEKMQEIVPNTTEAALEKHVPVVQVQDGKVTVVVGSTEHPMSEEHSIEWIALQTTVGYQYRQLSPGDKPCACFALAQGELPEAVYAYCNLHGLWETSLGHADK